jgi:hypothetical protein
MDKVKVALSATQLALQPCHTVKRGPALSSFSFFGLRLVRFFPWQKVPAEERTALRGLGCEPGCRSRRLSREVFTASSYPGSGYNKHSTADALPDGRYVDGPLKAWFRGALPRRRRGEGRL